MYVVEYNNDSRKLSHVTIIFDFVLAFCCEHRIEYSVPNSEFFEKDRCSGQKRLEIGMEKYPIFGTMIKKKLDVRNESRPNVWNGMCQGFFIFKISGCSEHKIVDIRNR